MYHEKLRSKKKTPGQEWESNTYTLVEPFPGFDRHHVQAPRPKKKLQIPTTV
jgi:hypothetical protein